VRLALLGTPYGGPIVMPRITVIIPTLDEEENVGACLAALDAQPGPLEVIVADGGSGDRTVAIAAQTPGVRVVEAPRGRAAQMNAAAAAATGEILWFVHADCRPPAGAATAIRDALARDGMSGGAFRFTLAGRGWRYRLVEWGVRLRCRLFHLPYGDQGIFLRRETFAVVGGYRETPLFEDLYLVRALRRRGRVVTLPEAMATSPRRCARDGILRTVVRNQTLLLLERLGVAPERLVALRTSVQDTRTGRLHRRGRGGQRSTPPVGRASPGMAGGARPTSDPEPLVDAVDCSLTPTVEEACPFSVSPFLPAFLRWKSRRFP